jgi:hypothetical protein
MSSLATCRHPRYLGGMTELNALKYVAAAVVLVLILGFLMFWEGTRGFGAALQRQSWLFVGIPLHILYMIVGYFMGLGAMLALMALSALYALSELWFHGSPNILASARYRLREYRRIRVHSPAH